MEWLQASEREVESLYDFYEETEENCEYERPGPVALLPIKNLKVYLNSGTSNR